MIAIGQFNELTIDRFTSVGAYLTDGEGDEVLLPKKYIPPGDIEKGSTIRVFVYKDNENRPVATTLKPYAVVGQFACLRVKEVGKVGAFLDWGVEKDLFVPFNQMANKMEAGKTYLIIPYIDELTGRLAATSNVNGFLRKNKMDLEEGQEVDLLISGEENLGMSAIINNKFRGLIFKSEIYKDLLPGDRIKGFVRQIRPDGKIDLSLRKQGMENLEEGAGRILEELNKANGFLPLHDKSSPEDIQHYLEMSKKNFKRSLGTLYKKKLVKLEPKGIRIQKKST